MKLLQILHKPQRRGAEIFAYQLSQTLRRKGVDVRIVYLYPHQGEGSLPLGPDDAVFDGAEDAILETVTAVQPRKLQSLLHMIDSFQPDIVQVNGGRTVKYGAIARMLRKNQPWTLVYRNIGQPQDWVQDPLRRLFYRYVIMPNLGGIVGVSRTTLAIAYNFYQLSIPAKFIPRAVDPAALQPTISASALRERNGTPGDAPLVLYIGSLSHEKRLDRLLRITAQARSQLPNLHLWIVGEGRLRRELEAISAGLGLQDAVRFLGAQENVADYIHAADLVALTSDTEGIPGVVLEAGFLGKAVVATRVGGVHECVREEETALLIDPLQEERFAQAMVDLLNDHAKRGAMGAAAKQWISANFLMDRIAQEYLTFYEQFAQPTPLAVKSPIHVQAE